MDLNKIRNMSDEELSKFLSKLKGNKDKTCCKCGSASSKTIKVEVAYPYHQTKMLCKVCDNCYQELLTFLDTFDIEW